MLSLLDRAKQHLASEQRLHVPGFHSDVGDHAIAVPGGELGQVRELADWLVGELANHTPAAVVMARSLCLTLDPDPLDPEHLPWFVDARSRANDDVDYDAELKRVLENRAKLAGVFARLRDARGSDYLLWRKLSQGDDSDKLVAAKEGIENFPFELVYPIVAARSAKATRQWDEVAAAAEHGLVIDPKNSELLDQVVAGLGFGGSFEKAIDRFRTLGSLDVGIGEEGANIRQSCLGNAIACYCQSGRVTECAADIEPLLTNTNWHRIDNAGLLGNIACVMAQVDRTEAAIVFLERMLAVGNSRFDWAYVESESDFDAIRGTAAYRRLAGRHG